jgi:hypothetical protein
MRRFPQRGAWIESGAGGHSDSNISVSVSTERAELRQIASADAMKLKPKMELAFEWIGSTTAFGDVVRNP